MKNLWYVRLAQACIVNGAFPLAGKSAVYVENIDLLYALINRFRKRSSIAAKNSSVLR